VKIELSSYKYFLLIIIIIQLFGCITPRSFVPEYCVRTISDEFEGHTINQMEWNLLGARDVSSKGLIFLNVQKYTKGVDTLYSLVILYIADDWLFIRDGESLVLLADGERIGFTGKGSSSNRNVSKGGSVTENAHYKITEQQLINIIGANEIKVKIVGTQYYAQRFFTEENIKNFRLFVQEYVTPISLELRTKYGISQTR
jgi:hypothetical protein